MRIICTSDFTTHVRRPGSFDNRMAYVLGFQELGHDVAFMVDVDEKQCYDSRCQRTAFPQWEGRHAFESITKSYGIWPSSCLLYNEGEATHGLPFDEAVRIAKSADLLVAIGGRPKTAAIWEPVRCRAYVDINPAKTQVYAGEYRVDYGFERYHHFFTYGLNIGLDSCEIPTCNLRWHGLLPPVYLSDWPKQENPQAERFTTISTWSGRSTFNFKGRYSGEKSDQWQTFIELPKKTNQPLEIALQVEAGYAKDAATFREHGWLLTDPERFHTLDDYRRYIGNSRGEFSVAHNRYVQFNTGWVSDRTARYLAAGKPALVQSTGLNGHLPAGKGFLTFSTLEDAVAGLEAINGSYTAHCQAARTVAEEYFDSNKVLSKMLHTMGF